MGIRARAKGLTKRMQDNYIYGRLGMVMDGTGKDYKKIEGYRRMLGDFGYETYMIFVNTSLETALERNRKRKRRLSDELVTKMWQDVQQNIGKFQSLFGTDNIIIVDNNGDDTQLIADVEKVVRRKLNEPIKNQIGKQWLKNPI
jgi:predicted kinase